MIDGIKKKEEMSENTFIVLILISIPILIFAVCLLGNALGIEEFMRMFQ